MNYFRLIVITLATSYGATHAAAVKPDTLSSLRTAAAHHQMASRILQRYCN